MGGRLVTRRMLASTREALERAGAETSARVEANRRPRYLVHGVWYADLHEALAARRVPPPFALERVDGSGFVVEATS